MGQAPHLTFRHITRSSGLPIDEVTALAQDSSGFVWIGSRDGLHRYDGFTFKSFYWIRGDKYSVPGNEITRLFVSPKGIIWVATLKGGIASMTATGKVLHTYNSATNSLFTPQADYVTDVKEDKDGNSWWTTVDGLFKLSVMNNRIYCYKLKTSLPRGNSFSSFEFEPNGNLLVCGLSGLFRFDVSTSTFSQPFNHAGELQKVDFSAIYVSGHQLWHSTWNPDFGVYDTIKRKEQTLYSGLNFVNPDYNRMVRRFLLDSKGTLWIGTGSGLLAAEPNTPAIKQAYTYEAGNRYSILNNDIQTILEDREGNLWVGHKEGISITQPYRQLFHNLSVNAFRHAPFGNKEVTDIIETDSNQLLIGTTGAEGTYLTGADFLVKKHYWFHAADYDWIWTHYKDKPRNRILISAQNGLLEYTGKHGLKRNPDPALNHKYPISSFAATSDSILWVSRFRNSFIRYNLNNTTYKEYTLESLGEKQQVLYLATDLENNIWLIAHNTGLLLFDEKKEAITKRLVPLANGTGLQQNGVVFFLDIGDYYLIGYDTKGISLYEKSNGRWLHYTRNDGLCNNSTRAAVQANDGMAWIATANGLSRFDPVSKSFTTYNYDDGILSNDFRTITQLSDGRIVAGSIQGLVAFTPTALKKVHNPLPLPFVTGVSVYNRVLPLDSLSALGRGLFISYKENSIAVDFISPYYQAPGHVEYAYKMVGLNKDWIPTGQQHAVSFNGLKGGRYSLNIRARLPGGAWVESRQPFNFTVGSPFYTQWWFFILAALAIILFIYLLFRYRLQQALQLERMRTSISSDLHDEVGASLTSISLFSEMARQEAAPQQKREEYLQRIGERSRDSIEKMGDIIWSINPENDNMQQMLVRMKNYATEISEAKDIILHWTESGNLAHWRLSMDQRKNVYLFFKEAMNNAVKHSCAKNIRLQLAATPHAISIMIHDDGKGFDTDKKFSGNGLNNLQRRANQLHGKCTISSNPGEGSSIGLQFPFSRK